jgi:hypothetical protein
MNKSLIKVDQATHIVVKNIISRLKSKDRGRYTQGDIVKMALRALLDEKTREILKEGLLKTDLDLIAYDNRLITIVGAIESRRI